MGGGCQVPWPGGRIEGLRSSSVRLPALDLHPRLCRTSGTFGQHQRRNWPATVLRLLVRGVTEDRRALFRARASPSSIGATTVSCSRRRGWGIPSGRAPGGWLSGVRYKGCDPSASRGSSGATICTTSSFPTRSTLNSRACTGT